MSRVMRAISGVVFLIVLLAIFTSLWLLCRPGGVDPKCLVEIDQVKVEGKSMVVECRSLNSYRSSLVFENSSKGLVISVRDSLGPVNIVQPSGAQIQNQPSNIVLRNSAVHRFSIRVELPHEFAKKQKYVITVTIRPTGTEAQKREMGFMLDDPITSKPYELHL